MRISLTDFGPLVDDFFKFMQRTSLPKNEVKELWYQRIIKLNAKDVMDGFEWMKANLDSVPYNIPKALKRAIFEANKHKTVPTAGIKSYGDCEYCNGTGTFKARVCSETGQWYEPIYFCSHCKNWKNWVNDPSIQRYTFQELEAMNIKFKPYNKVLMRSVPSNHIGKTEQFREMAVSFGESKRLNDGMKYKNRFIDPGNVD